MHTQIQTSDEKRQMGSGKRKVVEALKANKIERLKENVQSSGKVWTKSTTTTTKTKICKLNVIVNTTHTHIHTNTYLSNRERERVEYKTNFADYSLLSIDLGIFLVPLRLGCAYCMKPSEM